MFVPGHLAKWQCCLQPRPRGCPFHEMVGWGLGVGLVLAKVTPPQPPAGPPQRSQLAGSAQGPAILLQPAHCGRVTTVT